MQSTLNGMREAREDLSDKEIVRMRFAYNLSIHKQRLKAVLQEYEKGPRELSRYRAPALPVTSLANEERSLQKVTDANRSRLRQQLLRSQLMAKQRRKENERLEAERRDAERRQKQAIARLAEQSRREEEAMALRAQARLEDQRQQAERSQAQLAEYEEKDSALRARLDEMRESIANRNAAKRQRNEQRQEKIRLQSGYLEEKRRTELQQRMQQFEDGRRQHRAQRATEHAQRRAEAEERAVQIKEATQRRDELLRAKIELAEAKERRADEKIHEQQQERSEGMRRKMLNEAEREAQRQEAYNTALENANQRIQELRQRDEDERIRSESLKRERGHARKVRQEKARQKQLEKQDKVLRSRRIDESRRGELLSFIESKHETMEVVRATKEEMAKRRREQREEADKSRVKPPDDSPGPCDYLISQGDTGTEGPKWHFGLPANAMGTRTVQRHVAPPGVVTSPGPSAYRVEACDKSTLRSAAMYSFPKEARGRDRLVVTPGPQDYAPETPSPQRRARSSMK